MAYKIDLHCHSWYSADGVSSPEELIASAKARGLDGFAITDHNTCEAYRYMVDQGLASRDGSPVGGFLVVPGVEVSTAEGHLLCLGVVLSGRLKGTPAAEICSRVHALGGIAIPAHPYDYFRAGIRESVLDGLEIDGLEVFNSATTLKRCNERALEYARARGLPMTAGSDAHHEAAIGTAYTELDAQEWSVKGVLDQIRRRTELHCEYLTFKHALRKTWNNWMRLRRRRPASAATS
jgi:predicted metal-dependent phosphoesterase TrpH